MKDPRLYNPKKKAATTVAPEPDLGLTGGVDPFDNTNEWYNKPDSNGDESNPEEGGFSAEEFQRIQITGWFSDKNVPTYTMTTANVWAAGDEFKREYVHSKAPNTEGQGWSISGVTYYQYRGLNPSYAADGNYNKVLQTTGKGSPKLSRFFFYRFTGYGGGVQWLDNNLIAVDTYSKLVFAFSEPVEFSSMGAPTKWSPTDASPYIGQMYQFYQYDPVGYVKKKADGSYEVVLYQWFQDNLAKGNYKTKIDTAYTKIAEKKPDGAGKSPFNNHTADFFKENMKLLAGTPFYRREVKDGVNGLVLYKYLVSQDGETITRTAESWNGLATDADLTQKTYNVGEGTTATKGSVTGEYSGELELADESRTLRFGNGEVAVSNFTDPGPDWLERVKHGPTYKLGVTKYEFSEQGTKLTMTWQNIVGQTQTATYTYEKQESNSQARYGGYLVQLYNKDNDIRCSTVPNVAVWSSVMEYLAHLDIKIGNTFTQSIKAIPFSVRSKDDQGLDGDTLYSIIFGSDGKTATIKETVYDGLETSSTVPVTDGSSGNQGQVNGQSVTLVQGEDGSYQITYLERTYHAYYSDPGPAFIYRVRNKTYVEAGKTKDTGYSYTFSPDGRTCTYKNPSAGFLEVGEASYTYYDAEKRDDSGISAAYNGPYQFGSFGTVWGFKLTASDTTLAGSSAAMADANSILGVSGTFTSKPASLVRTQ